MRNVKTISISIPPDVLALVDQAAKETGLTRSSFISWALSTNEQGDYVIVVDITQLPHVLDTHGGVVKFIHSAECLIKEPMIHRHR